MPIDKFGHGFGDCTPTKQAHFRKIVGMHMTICQGIMKSRQWAYKRYVYFDLTAGAGIYECNGATVKGSPIIVKEEAEARRLPIEAHLFECGKAAADALRGNVPPTGFKVYECDHVKNPEQLQTAMQPYAHLHSTQCFGMIYADPNGSLIPMESVLKLLAYRPFRTMDFLAYLSGTTIKRVSKALDRDDTFSGTVSTLGKRTIFVRVPEHHHQWTFVLASNWEKFPQLEKQGFYLLDSERGQEISTMLDNTGEELAAMGWKRPQWIKDTQDRYRKERERGEQEDKEREDSEDDQTSFDF